MRWARAMTALSHVHTSTGPFDSVRCDLGHAGFEFPSGSRPKWSLELWRIQNGASEVAAANKWAQGRTAHHAREQKLL